MRIAVVVSHVGVPRTLASTTFVGALMDGFSRVGARARVFGLTQNESDWKPDALGGCEAVAPWVCPPVPERNDRVEAARRGILDGSVEAPDDDDRDWYLELLLERELESFLGDDDRLSIMVFPRLYGFLSVVCRIAARRGWSTITFATETPSDSLAHIDDKEAYTSLVSRCADGVTAVSYYLAEYWVARGIPPDHTHVMPTPVNASWFTSAPRTAETGDALYFGNLRHGQVEYLLDAVDIIKEHVDGFRLVIYGDAEPDAVAEWREVVESRSLADAVDVRNPVLPAELPRVLSESSVLLVPPRESGECKTGGFPIKLVIGLAAGCPVVTTRMGDIPEYLTDGESALLVDPGDIPGFADAVVRVLKDSELAARIGAGGKIVAECQFLSSAVAQRVVTFLEALPPRPRGRVSAGIRAARARIIASELGSAAHGWVRSLRGHEPK